ncbi:tRNA(Ile)-lysidine synthase TilS/MesJ [Lachnospiraceae bacterium C7]|nr:tRNA(Ile)-lysidine synthase TilS/MesJ [Lachnospiraceae bacterium C7]
MDNMNLEKDNDIIKDNGSIFESLNKHNNTDEINIEKYSISILEFQNIQLSNVTLIDIRETDEYQYGFIPGAINIVWRDIEKEVHSIEKNKPVIVYSQKTDERDYSINVVQFLRSQGFEAKYLNGGYIKWILSEMDKVNIEEKNKDIELSIRKKFHKQLFSKFAKAINTYELLQPGDKVMVCISGGKDSMLMAKLFQELKKHNKFEFDLEFVVMDPGYSQANRKVIENNANIMNIPIKIFESDIFDAVYDIEKSPCYLCARMRRGHLYHYAQKLGCNKIALGHHYDDVIETILMGMLYGAQVQTMMPKLHSTNFEGLELIRPMYLIREDDVKKWRDYNKLYFLQCACKFTEECVSSAPDNTTSSKRMEIKELIKTMKQTNPYVESNIFKSVENVNLKTIIAYKSDGVKHSFLDEY